MANEARSTRLRPSPIDDSDARQIGAGDRRQWFGLPLAVRTTVFLVPYLICVVVVSTQQMGFVVSLVSGSILFFLSLAMPAALGKLGTILGIIGCIAGFGSILIWAERPVGSYYSAIASFQLAAIGAILIIDRISRSNERYLAELRELALTDALTGLYNRRTFEERLRSEWARAMRGETELSIVLLDVDAFKSLNDTRGHAAGDAALRTVAESLRTVCRAADVPCRIGGDEFAVIVPDTGKGGTESFVARLLERSREIASDPATRAGSVTISVGAATGPSGSLDADALVGRADTALYSAKRAGGDSAVIE